ncbi:MAG: DUF1566 domain-containing protein [Rhodoferax sp.]|nr:DUF1566 domain-containing protein [Rhodoferax sp.]
MQDANPSISSQPAAQTITAGQTATFSVVATGIAPLGYQWKKGGINIPDAINSTYTTPVMSSAGSGVEYSVVVSNSAGTVTSSSATLTVHRYSLVANASGGFYDKTECVKDNSTGRVWEGKTASGPRAGTLYFTNYDSITSAQKYDGSAYVNPTQTEMDALTNSIGYRNFVNASALCGFTDWRLPTKDALKEIVLSGTSPTIPTIDATWFPNTQAGYYWTSSPFVGNSSVAWAVYFANGDTRYYSRDIYASYVRLVR